MSTGISAGRRTAIGFVVFLGACSGGSTPRDQNFGSDAGRGFEASTADVQGQDTDTTGVDDAAVAGADVGAQDVGAQEDSPGTDDQAPDSETMDAEALNPQDTAVLNAVSGKAP